MKVYLLVRDVPPPKRWASEIFTAEMFASEFMRLGFKPSGFKTGGPADGEPTFDRLFGPLVEHPKDGRTVIRYETWPVARMLSE